MQLKELIQAAVERHGSARAVAAILDIKEQSLSGYKAGTRRCGIEMHARLAYAAGLSDSQVRDHVWEVLRDRLGKMARTAAAVLLGVAFMGANFAQPAGAGGPKSDNVYYVNLL